jgi:hypothetical protein
VLIAEEFLLLCLDEVSGRKSISGEKIDPALGAALLVELALMERISVSGDEEGWVKRRRVSIISTKPTDDAVLDDALTFVEAREGRKVEDLVRPTFGSGLTKELRVRLLRRLAAAGTISEQRGKVLGIFGTTTWPTRDRRAEDDVRARLRSALVDGLTPTEPTVALIGLLHATGHVHAALPEEDKKLVRSRAKELADGDWAARVVKNIIDGIHAAGSAGV